MIMIIIIMIIIYLRANRIDARIVNHQEKKVTAMEMSCPWVSRKGDEIEICATQMGAEAEVPRVRDFTV